MAANRKRSEMANSVRRRPKRAVKLPAGKEKIVKTSMSSADRPDFTAGVNAPDGSVEDSAADSSSPEKSDRWMPTSRPPRLADAAARTARKVGSGAGVRGVGDDGEGGVMVDGCGGYGKAFCTQEIVHLPRRKLRHI